MCFATVNTLGRAMRWTRGVDVLERAPQRERPHLCKGVNEMAAMMASIAEKWEKQAVFSGFEHAERF